MPRLRILVSAFALSPYRGSENAIGWNIVTRLRKFHDVMVLCGDLEGRRPCFRDLKRFRAENGEPPGLNICYIPPSPFVVFLFRAHRVPGFWWVYYGAYRLWQRAAYRVALRLHSEKPFSAVHQLNMLGYREPGYLWKLPAPFIWGPIAGASDDPWAYFQLFALKGKLNAALRKVVNSIQKHISFRARRAARKASKLWTATPADYEMVCRIWGCGPAEFMLDTGTFARPGLIARTWNAEEPLRLAWSGLHIDRKALPIILKAISELKDPRKIRLAVIGHGPETANWMLLAKRLGIEELVEWTGWLSHEDAMARVSAAHVFAFTSIREATSNVVMEAIGLGIPVICHDACGMGIAINSSCGIKVPLQNPRLSIDGFKLAIQSFLDEPRLVDRLSEGALERAAELSWDRKAAAMAATYQICAEQHQGDGSMARARTVRRRTDMA
jgi:glycosyltransferase involved in cell wall biosynthesis